MLGETGLTISSKFARAVYNAAVKNTELDEEAKNGSVELFRPGRMVYEFDLHPYDFDSLPTNLLQSSYERNYDDGKVL